MGRDAGIPLGRIISDILGDTHRAPSWTRACSQAIIEGYPRG